MSLFLVPPRKGRDSSCKLLRPLGGEPGGSEFAPGPLGAGPRGWLSSGPCPRNHGLEEIHTLNAALHLELGT